MLEVIRFKNFVDYANFNQDFIYSNPLLYYHLEHSIGRVLNEQIAVYDFFNIKQADQFLAVLFIDNECLIYSNSNNEELLTKLEEELQFHKFKRNNFFGTYDIIDSLFKKNNVEFKTIKHRIIYDCKVPTKDFIYTYGELVMGDINKLEELANFNIGFTKEYFGDVQPLEKAISTILAAIQDKNLYQWNIDDEIGGIIQAMHNEFDFPVIGHVFTNPNYRNKNIAASMVHRVTKGLLDAGNEKCMLVADAFNPYSNKAFVKAGYLKTGEYVVRYKEK